MLIFSFIGEDDLELESFTFDDIYKFTTSTNTIHFPVARYGVMTRLRPNSILKFDDTEVSINQYKTMIRTTTEIIPTTKDGNSASTKQRVVMICFLQLLIRLF